MAAFSASGCASTPPWAAKWTRGGRSLFYLEKLRIFHAVVTVLLALGLLAWAIMLWQQGAATTGDVVLACTLAISVLSATRDLAVALVDITQHVARAVGSGGDAPGAARSRAIIRRPSRSSAAAPA